MQLVYGIILLAVLGAIVLMAKFYFTNTRRMTSHTEGQVVSAEEKVIIENDRRRVETRVIVRYAVYEKEYTLALAVPGGLARAYPSGRVIPIRYNPAEPEMAAIAEE